MDGKFFETDLTLNLININRNGKLCPPARSPIKTRAHFSNGQSNVKLKMV